MKGNLCRTWLWKVLPRKQIRPFIRYTAFFFFRSWLQGKQIPLLEHRLQISKMAVGNGCRWRGLGALGLFMVSKPNYLPQRVSILGFECTERKTLGTSAVRNFWVATAQTGQVSVIPQNQAELLWVAVTLECHRTGVSLCVPEYNLHNFLYNFTMDLLFPWLVWDPIKLSKKLHIIQV